LIELVKQEYFAHFYQSNINKQLELEEVVS